jgi:hypothetical protein
MPLILAQLAGRKPIALASDVRPPRPLNARAALQVLTFTDWAAIPDAVCNYTLTPFLLRGKGGAGPGWDGSAPAVAATRPGNRQ